MALFFRPHVWDGLKDKPKKKKKKAHRGRMPHSGENQEHFDDFGQMPDLPPSYEEVSRQSELYNSAIPVHGYNDPSNHQKQTVQPGGFATPYGYSQQSLESWQPLGTDGMPNKSANYKLELGPDPCMVNCPNCGSHVTTRVDHIIGKPTCLIGSLLCLFGCWPCCLMVCCSSKLKDSKHNCPSCREELGTVKKM